MADITFVSVPPKSLQQTIDGDATTFKLTDINDWNGTALSSASFGTYAWAVFRNTTNTRIEFMRIDPASITSATSPITIVKRGLAFDGSDTEVAANKLTWTQNDTIVELGTHSPQILNYTVRTEGNQTVNGVKTFSSTPVSTAGLPTSSTEFATKQYVDNTATGTTTINRVVTAGTAGETIVAGNLVYLKASDGRWWLCDADTAVTVENINMGIAQGAGTAGNAITNGVLTYGLDSNQTGLTANSVYYASNTAGAISLTPGTKEVTVGYALSTTTLLFNYRFNQGITEDQQDALVGDDGTPSGSNTYVTQTGLQKQAEVYAASTTGNDTYVVTLSPAPASLVNGMTIRFKPDTANTGAATLNVNGLGAFDIVTGLSTALATGDILANQVCEVIYNSTGAVWQLVNPVPFSSTTALSAVEPYVPNTLPTNSTWYTWTSNMFFYTDSGPSYVIPGWTLNAAISGSPGNENGGAGDTYFQTNANIIYSSVPGNGSNNTYTAASSKDIRVKYRAKLSSMGPSNYLSIGFSDAASTLNTVNTDINISARFTLNNATLYAVNGDGTTNTSTNVSASLTYTNWNVFEIVFNPGTDIKYYINGTLVATHTTNLPTGSLKFFGIGSNASTDIRVGGFTFSLEQ